MEDSDVENFLSNLSDEVTEIDMSLNRLTSKSLKTIVQWLKKHINTKICVQNNQFSFDSFYKNLQTMDAIYLISEGHLNMSSTTMERRIEMLALDAKKSDVVLSLIQTQILLGSNIAAESNKNDIKHDLAMKQGAATDLRVAKLTESVNRAVGWVSNQNIAYEKIITCALQLYLEKEGYTIVDSIVDKSKRTIPQMGEDFDPGVEWDGVLYCQNQNIDDAPILFLIEAKTNADENGITSMPERIKRTKKFIHLCGNDTLPPKDIKKKREATVSYLCKLWKLFSGCSIRGVVGAPVMTPAVTAILEKECYIQVRERGELYIVFDGEKKKETELNSNELLSSF